MSDPSLNALNALTPEKWKRPDEVMKLHRLRMKKRALQTRLDKRSPSSLPSQTTLNSSVDSTVHKRKNPFSSRSGELLPNDNGKKVKTTEIDEEASNDTTLFKLLNLSGSERDTPLNFSNILSRITSTSSTKSKAVPELQKGTKEPPVDWTLRTKLRIMAQKPFPWNTTLRTCEEASGITGFVRCIDSSSSESSLDTSPNAKFHQCCLLWQHPSLPWLELYPRQSQRGGGNSTPTTPPPQITSHPSVRDSLQRHWADSFRSLYQLLRARQCPYFYFVSNTFTCLFRAAGICGFPHTHVMITPTTRGFRKTLRDQEIEFRMPLRPHTQEESEDTGYETLDTTASRSLEQEEGEDEEGEEGEEAEQWLESMGVEAAEIRRISSVQADADITKEKKMDRTPESLVLIEDAEAHVLFNMLLNSKSCVSTTGPLAGVPPTLLAPTAFYGATLRSLKVRESKVQVGKDSFYSMEVVGPVLPSTVQQLCNLLHNSVEQFSLTLASHETTKAFTVSGNHATINRMLKIDKENVGEENSNGGNSAFSQEGLSDGGLPTSVLKRFCSSSKDSLQQFDSIKYSNEVYSWS